ncbi:lipase 3-like [Diaphorina citri]|uniref:Lipase 3-like n=1 Tax=Diaphorina citri TaxID=121845 RepID=A0A3Q0INL3_DIACI|nr:lipase 3-like [Diaphorina citri]
MNELGLYDTTATIDYILNQTGHNSLITLGHSLGTTNVLIAGSLRPEYQTKVRLNVLWAQSAFLGNLVTRDMLEGLYGIYAEYQTISGYFIKLALKTPHT